MLDAAARHLSFTRAADELAVTPAAVGQQIRALEDTLGAVLFRRTTKGLELTPEGRGPGWRRCARGFSSSSRNRCVRCRRGNRPKSVTIAAPRDLTAKWLIAAARRDRARRRRRCGFMLVPADEGGRLHPRGQPRPGDPLGRGAGRA
ncbi:MAG: LysR family transcriptional regulator [Sphingomonas sp.]